MINRIFVSTESMTGRLAAFFALLSIVVGTFCYATFNIALMWSEDRVGERRILLDRDYAVERFLSGESGRIKVDFLTTAYNDLSLVPKEFDKYIVGQTYFLGETDETSESHMLYFGEYTHKGEPHPIVLLSEIDRVEFTSEEILFPLAGVLALISILMFSFGTMLNRLSQRLIEPINELTRQLELQRGEIGTEFSVSEFAAEEFQLLTQEMNQYRSEIKSLIQREQAFARYASHELRTPLTVMQGSAKLLEQSDKTDFQSRQITRISDATYQMKTMVDALLSLVRYERSHDDTPIRILKKSELDNIVQLNSAQAADKEIKFDVQVESLPRIQASEAVMNMVLGNLIRNAIAVTQSDTIRVRVSDKELTVKDEGEGLKAEPSRDGHGMGLLIVEHLCRRFSWEFELSNHPEGGCIAVIRF